jgi:hypothetical protein
MPTRSIASIRLHSAGSAKAMAMAIARLPDSYNVSAEPAYLRAWESFNLKGLIVRGRSRLIIERYRDGATAAGVAAFRSFAGGRIADIVSEISSRDDIGYAALQGKEHHVFVWLPD